MRLILIRHGDSQHSLHGIIADVVGCTGLTKPGVQQATVLARRLTNSREVKDCVAILSSPVLRARQTAEIIKTALCVDTIVEDVNICELRPGKADGMHRHAYREQYGEFNLQEFPERPFSVGGESWSEFMDRVRTTLNQLAEKYADQTVVAVSHAGFIVASMLILFNIPRPGTGTWMDPINTAITEWEFSNKTWRLVRYNDAFHLNDEG